MSTSKLWLNPPRGGGVVFVEPTINNTAYYKWGNHRQRVWRFPQNTATDLHPMARHWLMDYTYGKGLIVHQRSHYTLNQNYIRKPFTKEWLQAIYWKQAPGKIYLIPWLLFIYGAGACGMRAYDNSAYDYFYFTD
ncbi:unnamed protein product [Blepharisma stoltei]|uniref:Uncharacterized protein n=1 Tax=Blepharisma stoltei TaxID=1481888 RepID=A0AAU9JAI4_9CILI|nr:unnamed protein product [Blepharisma stoltei]CAG9327743.1 unnamed protein product [Blepharisma stoltei]